MTIRSIGAEFPRVTSTNTTDLLEILQVDSTTAQYAPKTITAGNFSIFPSDIVANVAGKGLKIKEGSNARMGTATLVAGTVTVANTSVTASTRIFITRYSSNSSTALGVISVGTVTASTSFVINALKTTDATVQTSDVSIVDWILVEPA